LWMELPFFVVFLKGMGEDRVLAWRFAVFVGVGVSCLLALLLLLSFAGDFFDLLVSF